MHIVTRLKFLTEQSLNTGKQSHYLYFKFKNNFGFNVFLFFQNCLRKWSQPVLYRFTLVLWWFKLNFWLGSIFHTNSFENLSLKSMELFTSLYIRANFLIKIISKNCEKHMKEVFICVIMIANIQSQIRDFSIFNNFRKFP